VCPHREHRPRRHGGNATRRRAGIGWSETVPRGLRAKTATTPVPSPWETHRPRGTSRTQPGAAAELAGRPTRHCSKMGPSPSWTKAARLLGNARFVINADGHVRHGSWQSPQASSITTMPFGSQLGHPSPRCPILRGLPRTPGPVPDVAIRRRAITRTPNVASRRATGAPNGVSGVSSIVRLDRTMISGGKWRCERGR